MNRKVFISMLILCISFLIGLYILKIFFPQEFMLNIQNENLVKIGKYIDDNIWIRYIVAGITAFITYWLFMCACKRKLYLNWKEILIVIGFIVAIRLIGLWDNEVATHISICSFFLIPLICKFDLKIATCIYAFHGLAQILSLKIRNLPMYLTQINYATIFLLGIESYFWLLLFYIIFNYKKEVNNNEKD